MKSLFCVKTGDPIKKTRGEIAFLEVPVPEVGPYDILVKVAYCSICGSDPHAIDGFFAGVATPMALGHEVSGTIVKVGEKTSKDLKVGDRVTANFFRPCRVCYNCRNGMENACSNAWSTFYSGYSEYILYDESQVYKIPDGVSLKEACLTEPLAIALRAVEKADIPVGGKVAISGAGGLGLMIAMVARISGAASVTVIEPVDAKLELAKSFGIDYTINPVTQNLYDEAMKITNGRGYDSIIEASGAKAATAPALKIAAQRATVVFFSMYPVDFELPVNLFNYTYSKELTIRGFLNSLFNFNRTVNMLPRINLNGLIQKVYPLDQVFEAIEQHRSGKFAKIVVKCGDEE